MKQKLFFAYSTPAVLLFWCAARNKRAARTKTRNKRAALVVVLVAAPAVAAGGEGADAAAESSVRRHFGGVQQSSSSAAAAAAAGERPALSASSPSTSAAAALFEWWPEICRASRCEPSLVDSEGDSCGPQFPPSGASFQFIWRGVGRGDESSEGHERGSACPPATRTVRPPHARSTQSLARPDGGLRWPASHQNRIDKNDDGSAENYSYRPSNLNRSHFRTIFIPPWQGVLRKRRDALDNRIKLHISRQNHIPRH